jgi:hypothetical protein
MGALSSTQTVGTNVWVRLPKASELQQESKWNSSERKGMTPKARQTVVLQSPPPWGVHAGLFISKVMGLITMPQVPLTTYPTNRVHG